MAGYGQLGAVTGLKKRFSHVDEINAETPHLPALYQARQDKEFADKTFQFNKDQAKIQEDLEREAGHDARKEANRAQNLGYANLGISALSNANAIGDLYSSIMSFF